MARNMMRLNAAKRIPHRTINAPRREQDFAKKLSAFSLLNSLGNDEVNKGSHSEAQESVRSPGRPRKTSGAGVDLTNSAKERAK